MSDPHYDRRWLILTVIGIAQLLVVLDVTIVNIALPSAQQELGFSDSERQWIITAYALSFGSLLLLGGRIADLFGRKWTFIIGLLGFAGASALGGAAQSFGLLVGARALQGVFAAMLAPAALSLLATTFTEPRERAKAFGIYGAIAGAGGAFGLLLGGFLTEVLDWRWCLYVSILFAVPAAIGGLRLLHHVPVTSRPRLDIPGTLLASSGLFALVFGMSRAETDGWSDPVTLAFLGASVAAPGRIRRAPAPRRPPAAPAARGHRPQPRRRLRGDRDRRRRHLRRVPVPDVLPPEHQGPEPARDRPRVHADEPLDHRHGDAGEHQGARPHRPPPAHPDRHVPRRRRDGPADRDRRRHRRTRRTCSRL